MKNKYSESTKRFNSVGLGTWFAWCACFACFSALAGCGEKRPVYETAEAHLGTLQKTIAAQGKVEAVSEVKISSKVDGRIERLMVVEGAMVTKGQMLVQLDDNLSRAALNETQAKTNDALRVLNRAKKMFGQKAIPQAELDAGQGQYDVAVAQQRAAEVMLADHAIRSPLDGQVIKKFVNEGEFAKVGLPIFEVADLSKIFVRAEIDQTDIGYLKLSQKAAVTAEGFLGRVFPGTVAEIAQSVGMRKTRQEDPSKIEDRKVLDIKIDMQDARDLKLGMTVDVKIDIFKKENVLLIPKRAVKYEKQRRYVEVLDETEEITRKEIAVGISDDYDIEVTRGLQEGERVIVSTSTK